jgi:hypothetical protein
MENEMQEWENLWQKKEANDIDIDRLSNQLIKIERITRFQKILWLFVSVFSTYLMVTRLSLNWYNIISVVLIFLGFLFLCVPLFRNKITENKSTNKYVESQICYLKKKLLLPKVYLLIFIIFFISGLNIAFLGAFIGFENSNRLMLHFSTIILFIIFYIARNIGIKNYEKEILPLINNLEKIKK